MARFQNVGNSEREAIYSLKEAEGMKKSTKYAAKQFRDFLLFKHVQELNFEEFSDDQLDNLLTDFYFEARNGKAMTSII